MNEEPVKSPVSATGPEEGVVEQSTETRNSESENTSEVLPTQEPLAPSDELDAKRNLTSAPVELGSGEANEEAKAAAIEPPVDWFEPLEEDDEANNWDLQGPGQHFNGRKDPEEESLAGESEKSGSVASSERNVKRIYQLNVHRRKRSHPDEGWEEWSALGEGWKRREVVRRSGSSVGQKDVYYLSPHGDRVRSKVELASVLEGIMDVSAFEFKTGKFYTGDAPLPRGIRSRKRRVRERSSSESSWMERGEGADTPDSHHRLTPSLGSKLAHSNQTGFSPHSLMSTPNRGPEDEDALREDKVKLPHTASSRPLPSINGEIGSEEASLVCAKCGISFTGTWYDKQRKKPCCPSCWASKTREHPMIRFRKWIPCGQCVACHNTVNCGQCANCKHGLQSPESRKRICRKRKCICPIRKGPGGGNFAQQRPQNDVSEIFDDSMSYQGDIMDSQHPSYKTSDTEDFSVNVDVDEDEDMSTDDDDDWHKKRKRRSCGKCNACLCRKDCGTCDFCVDKPKFGGSNKKRQKCRLRQCQRQAMRHLLPFQLGQSDYGTQEGLLPVGRPRPHYTYSRKTKKSRAGLDFTDEDDDSNLQAMSWTSEPTSGSKPSCELNLRHHQSSMQLNHSEIGQRNGIPDSLRVPNISNHNSSQLLSRWDGEKSNAGRDGEKHTGEEVEEELPMITRIFSLADNPAGSGVDTENQLLKLLEALRASALPILWYAIVVEGPQLQLIQCSKQSSMTDTIVLIDPGFCYQVTVQKQPLLLTHPLYDDHPTHLTSVTEVVNLLLDLERYLVCQGLPSQELSSNKGPIILERASTCDFLVKKNNNICANCRALCRR
ncbi:methyl-CpG-binding domain protein 1b isoform X2 [Centroberyx affinis]|uniref:methyl-CpG-binding domain protein 1b isoform X2 n=1 Tax=Centroberyx affinis TaxID=166261 RepID=UPI003A5C252A